MSGTCDCESERGSASCGVGDDPQGGTEIWLACVCGPHGGVTVKLLVSFREHFQCRLRGRGKQVGFCACRGLALHLYSVWY